MPNKVQLTREGGRAEGEPRINDPTLEPTAQDRHVVVNRSYYDWRRPEGPERRPRQWFRGIVACDLLTSELLERIYSLERWQEADSMERRRESRAEEQSVLLDVPEQRPGGKVTSSSG